MLKRLVRRAAHAAAYHLLLKPSRRRTLRARAARFDLVVPPTVFHPRWFVSSETLAGFLGRLDLEGARVADVGTGSGVLALAAARAGAALVLAVDVNPAAARAAAENARRNGYGDRVRAVCGDLLSAVSPEARFDAIVSNPPFFAGEPRDAADRAWRAGPGYRDLAPLFAQARERLAPGGRLYLVLSSDSDLAALHRHFEDAALAHRVLVRRRLLFESLLVYELRPGATPS